MSAIAGRLTQARGWIEETTRRLDWLPLLLARLITGVIFIQSGWGKLHHLEKVTLFFTSLGLPAPALQARFVSTTELVGGCLVLVGLLARFASVPLMVTMVVAIVTAKVDELKGAGDLFGFNEYAYLVLLSVTAVRGAGALSLDALLVRLIPGGGELPKLGSPWVLASRAVAVGAAGALGLLTFWAAALSHNPCDKLGPGEFIETVTASKGGGDDADPAWQTCKRILEWKKEGKDPHQELKKEQEQEQSEAPSGG